MTRFFKLKETGLDLGGWLLICLFLAPGPRGQEVSARESKEALPIKQIRPVPVYVSEEIDLGRKIQSYFQVRGILDAVYETRIVVNDQVVPLLDVRLLQGIRKGAYIGVRVNRSGQAIEIQRLQARPD